MTRGTHAPAVSPILNAPACTPPTVAGPSTTLLFARAYAMSALVSRSGTPSAMMATVRIVGWRSAAMDDSDALRGAWVCTSLSVLEGAHGC
eukprot:352728-Chlamydomonas_euryale.AAC.2